MKPLKPEGLVLGSQFSQLPCLNRGIEEELVLKFHNIIIYPK